MARRAPRQARFPRHVWLGRDEPDRGQGSGQGGFPDGQVRLDLVAERQPTRPPAGDGAKGFKMLNWHGVGAELPGVRRHQEAGRRRRQEPGAKAEFGEVLYDRGVYNSDADRRGDRRRAEDHRQESRRPARMSAAAWRTSISTRRGSRPSASTASPARSRPPAPTTTATAPPSFSSGTARNG